MTLYVGIDLHSNNSYVVVLDDTDRVVWEKRLPNDLGVIVGALSPYGAEITGIAVESTYNWYWLVDGLRDAGWRLHLVNTWAMKQYDGLKYSDDRTDAAWLARTLRLGLLPEGYIYPRETRPVRDLLRKRTHLVQQKTSNLLSVQNLVARNTGRGLSGNRIKTLSAEEGAELVGDGDVALAMGASLAVMGTLAEQIAVIEKAILARVRLAPEFRSLLTVPGIGKILGLTIMLETGDVKRFAGVGNFASYCRCVDSRRLSNGKKKGQGNRKCGNKHLAWAFVEAANFAVRYDDRARRYHGRKKARTSGVIAIKAVAHKLARACFYVMRDQVPFDPQRCFG